MAPHESQPTESNSQPNTSLDAPILDAPSRHRVVALINPVLHCRSTCADLLEAGVNLVGIVEAQPRQAGLPIATFKRQAKKQGYGTALSQVAARLVYLAANRKIDKQLYRELFNEQHVSTVLSNWSGSTIRCREYSDSDAVQQVADLRPDILVVHSQSWVPKKVRDLAATGLVIGGHPGITPHYRGSHSSFWALLNQQPDMVGWTAFHVDKGVDTGDVIVQGRLQIEERDSFMSLNWRGMKQIAKAQAETILQYDRTGDVTRTPHGTVDEDSNFSLPGLSDYVRYRWTQQLAR